MLAGSGVALGFLGTAARAGEQVLELEALDVFLAVQHGTADLEESRADTVRAIARDGGFGLAPAEGEVSRGQMGTPGGVEGLVRRHGILRSRVDTHRLRGLAPALQPMSVSSRTGLLRPLLRFVKVVIQIESVRSRRKKTRPDCYQNRAQIVWVVSKNASAHTIAINYLIIVSIAN